MAVMDAKMSDTHGFRFIFMEFLLRSQNGVFPDGRAYPTRFLCTVISFSGKF